jgi:hypothetical protein
VQNFDELSAKICVHGRQETARLYAMLNQSSNERQRLGCYKHGVSKLFIHACFFGAHSARTNAVFHVLSVSS